jgi:uncharacterized membrane-anchored protein
MRMTRRLPRPLDALWREPTAAKVPEITVLFWVIKVLTTGMGEAISDFLGQKSIPLAAVVGLGGLAWAMWLQLRAPEYRARTYWFAVLMVAVFGTMAADGVHRGAGVPYSLSTPFFAVVVAGVFWLWHRNEGTLSIHSIVTRSREGYYWVAVLATFALGTALGDLTAFTLHLGFLASAVLFAVIISLPAIGRRSRRLDPVLAFWAAYVVTRPLGASIADWFAKPHHLTGMGWGDGAVSAIALVLFAALVAYVARTEHGVQPPHEAHRRARRPQPAGAESTI